MSLVFSALIPNHPSFGVSEDQPSATMKAIQDLEGELYIMKPDTIILLTDHDSQIPQLINANIANPLRNEAGTFSVATDVELATHIKESIDTHHKELPMTIIARSTVDPFITTPLQLLLKHLPDTKVIVISTGTVSQKKLFAFGDFLRHRAIETNTRVAIIAAGHLSQYPPAQHMPHHDKQSFDALCVEFLRTKQHERILHINENVIKKSHTDILQPFTVLLGVIHKLDVKTSVLSYERLFDQGQVVTNFVIK